LAVDRLRSEILPIHRANLSVNPDSSSGEGAFPKAASLLLPVFDQFFSSSLKKSSSGDDRLPITILVRGEPFRGLRGE
jgi:hypothetical protein